MAVVLLKCQYGEQKHHKIIQVNGISCKIRIAIFF